jgi:spermidine/putrescine-binding protein
LRLSGPCSPEKIAVPTARLLAVLALMIAGVLSSCRDDGNAAGEIGVDPPPDDAPAPADLEVLRLLVWEGYAPSRCVEEFEREIAAKYDREIRLEVSYVDGSDDFYDPIRDRRADLITISHHLFKDERFKFIAAELVLPLDLENIPNFEQVIPALREFECLRDGERVMAVPVARGPYGLAYNTHLVEEAPESWGVLWEPRYEGRYVLGAREYVYNTTVTALALGYPESDLTRYDALDNPLFRDRLQQLVAGADSFWYGQDTADDLSGLSLGAVWGDSLTALRERGEVWALAEPKEGTPFWIDAYAVTWTLEDRPFLKRVAEEWINKTLTVDFQLESIVRDLSIYPVVTGIAEHLTAEEKERACLDKLGSPDSRRLLQPTMSQRDRNGVQLLWKEAMRGAPSEGDSR